MPIIYHEEHPLDRAAMTEMRAMMKAAPALPFAPEGRQGYDALISHTPTHDDVTFTVARFGDVEGWLCRPIHAQMNCAILYIHGGGYVLGSADAYRGLASQIAARTKAVTFVPHYRLAPEHPFPTAFDDAVRAFDGLAAAGYDRIAIVGDSAGGGLTMALVGSGATSSRAVAAAVFSPWIDPSLSGETMTSRADDDPILTRESLQRGVDQYLGRGDPKDPRINALYGDMSILPPVRIDVGQDEILLDDALRFGTVAEAAGQSCEVHVWKGMVHVFPLNIAMLKAAAETVDQVAAFLEPKFKAVVSL